MIIAVVVVVVVVVAVAVSVKAGICIYKRLSRNSQGLI